MPYLTFGEQVKIVLSRKGMTIKELAEIIEERTGKKMSRQNLTQRLGRDNFQEQDMRMIASILECPFQLSILEEEFVEAPVKERHVEELFADEHMEAIVETPVEDEAEFIAEEPVEDIEEVAEDGMEEMQTEPAEDIAEEMLAEPEEDIAEEMRAEPEEDSAEEVAQSTEESTSERGMTVGEFLDRQEEMDEASSDKLLKEVLAEMDAIERENREKEQESSQHKKEKKSGWMSHLRFKRKEEPEGMESAEELVTAEDVEEPEANDVENTAEEDIAEETATVDPVEETFAAATEDEDAEDLELGEMNPYTGHEYETNSVRMHPKRIGYVQVYDRKVHKWTDMTEWAFLGYQERKKLLLGKDYEPPIYLD